MSGQGALAQVGKIAEFSAPVTVRVQLPPEASGLLYRPWDVRYYK